VKCADPTSLENDDMKLAAYMVDWLLRLSEPANTNKANKAIQSFNEGRQL